MNGKPNWWTSFLNSLATNGGNLFLLMFLSVVMIGAGVALMVKYGPTAPAVMLIVTSGNNAFVALIAILKGDVNREPAVPPIAPLQFPPTLPSPGSAGPAAPVMLAGSPSSQIPPSTAAPGGHSSP